PASSTSRPASSGWTTTTAFAARSSTPVSSACIPRRRTRRSWPACRRTARCATGSSMTTALRSCARSRSRTTSRRNTPGTSTAAARPSTSPRETSTRGPSTPGSIRKRSSSAAATTSTRPSFRSSPSSCSRSASATDLLGRAAGAPPINLGAKRAMKREHRTARTSSMLQVNGRGLVAAASLALLAACSTDRLLDVNAVDRVDASLFDKPENAALMVNSVVADFECAYASAALVEGLIADEFIDAQLGAASWPYDRRDANTQTSGDYGFQGCAGSQRLGIYLPLSTA